MTRVVRNRILKDANGDISDHLRNHIHLTNCIHLKNHMHKHSPILAERSLLRDLVVLQRSRSLRDPSASPPSWHSPSMMDMLSKRAENDGIIQEERKSIGIERQKDGRRSSGSSPPFVYLGPSKVVPGERSRNKATGNVAGGDRNSRSRLGDSKKVGREDSGRCNRNNILVSCKEPPLSQVGKDSFQEAVSGLSMSTDRKSSQRGKQIHNAQTENLSKQKSHDVPMDGDGVVSSNIHLCDKFPPHGKAVEEPEGGSVRGKCTGLNRGKRRKFRSAQRARAAASRDIGAENELSVASNSLPPGPTHRKYQIEVEEEGYSDRNVRNAPRNGCGLPWNWSIIHDRGKTFFDKAGRSFSCGLSDSRLKRASIAANGKNISEMPVASDHSGSSTKSDAEAMPLLIEASGSHESTEKVGWAHDYSGELGIYADHLLKDDIDSDLASEVRLGYHHKFRSNGHTRHQNLTQKYMPKTFRDMVGQTLVAQALANAVIKRKVGLLYVFYGPHGTGKTSCARIFARALNCQSSEHPKPCGFCNSCIAYDLDKNRNIREVGPVSNFDFENIMGLLDNMKVSQLPAQYRVFIFDDCDTLSPNSWSAISKVIDRAPRRLVFILVSSSLDVLPHIIISRCQKFFFPKLKDADIIYTLQWIASKEGLDIDKEALKLIASRSDGSLRDAEMTLEQLSLLGQRISVPLVQELVGLISDEKLVDLLDLALSADTVNTVKNLRVIMETGVESLALMSQLATVITDILAGSYDFTKERQKRKFFCKQPLPKEDMEKLRQALKTLSEAEKQLRMSNDKLTWLTAALLQLAPDQQYMLPTSSDNSFNHSPLPLNNAAGRDATHTSSIHLELSDRDKQLSKDTRTGTFYAGRPNNEMLKSFISEKKGHASTDATPQKMPLHAGSMIKIGERKDSGSYRGIEEIWLEVLKKIQVNGLKEFLYQEGNLSSLSFGAAPTVQLMFNTQQAKATAEKFRSLILQSFESVLGSSVIVEIRCDPKNSKGSTFQAPLILATSKDTASQIRDASLHVDSHKRDTGEIEEVAASPGGHKGKAQADVHALSCKRSVDSVVMEQQATSEKKPTMTSIPEGRTLRDGTQSQSLVRSKVSLAHVIQQAEGCTQQNSWSKRRAVSIAEKLEQENLRLESRSRSLLCWRASRARRRKLSRLKTRTRKPHKLLELVSCGRCLSTKSPR